MGLANHDLPPPPSGKYPAKAHAKRVAEYIAENGGPKEGVIYLEAQKTAMVEDDDQAAHFRQRRFFYYLSGCAVPDAYLAYDIKNDHLTLFIPPIDPEDVIWSGLPLLEKEALEKYDIDACKPSTEVNSYLTSPETPHKTILAIPKQVADHVTFLSFEETNWDLLKNAIERCRVVKDEHEIGLIRHANAISSHAHTEVMRMVKNARNERELMGTFVGACISNGGREQAYGCICASGPSAATLHYVHNDLPLSEKLNLLIDAGCEYNCYCSDITRTYPLQGKFTKESREIYDIVDEMQAECMEALKANVTWEDLHALAHEIAIDGLRRLGILTGGNKKELFDSRVSTLFLPHGLGHYLGMDTHDCGGNADYEDPDPMFRYLRIRGTVPANSVVTVEPGIYFCRFIIEPALKEEKFAKFVDKSVLEKYWDVGGVRIEDDVLVKEDGCENLTTAPRSWDEVEALIHSV
ncbi:X-Pro dipeptidase [Aureobasidium pullulans]|nr:X-Pro dipeptidase [Aureobasidium pullulans]